MQQRRLRLGDILDDYCPRERRITNHAVVAMIEEEVKQTRCATCDAEHEYKQAKVPLSRRKKTADSAAGDLEAAAALARMADSPSEESLEELPEAETFVDDAPLMAAAEDDALPESESEEPLDDDGPVHRRLIRATLPRPEGQVPERKAPDFTMHNPGGRFDPQRNGQRHRGGRQQGKPAGQSFGQQPARAGGPRQGSGRPGPNDGGAHRQRDGNRPGNAAGQRGGGRPFGANRGSRPGGGQGRKRGR